MASWDGKSHNSVLGYKIFVLTLKYAGLLPAYFFLWFVALYYFLFSPKSTKHIYGYLRKRMGFNLLNALFGVYRNYFVFGQTLIDRVAVIAGLSNKFTYDFDGEEHLHRMVQNGKGGILLSAHMGNWEIAGHLLYRIKTKINVVMHVAEHEKVKAYLDGVKGSGSMQVIVIRDDFSHIYEISQALLQGELICMHGDRFMPWSKTIPTQFLGDEALFPQGPFAMAASLKAPVSYVFAMKEGLFHYHFSATPSLIYTPKMGQSKQDLATEALKDFSHVMEKTIRKYPLQWFNYYDFWQKEQLMPEKR